MSLLAVVPVAFAPALSAQDSTSVPTSVVPLEKSPAKATRKTDTVDRIVAVVGNQVLTWNDVLTAVNQQREQGLQIPVDLEGQMRLFRIALNGLIDEEILVQKATDLNIEVSDQEIASQVDEYIRQTQGRFQDEMEFRAELRKAGFGSPEEFRRSMFPQVRRSTLQRKVFVELQKTAKPASVSEAEIDTAFERAREQLKKRPAAITFRQIIISPEPSARADSVARAKADSLLAAIKRGESFEAVAKRESMDSASGRQGGDLGWRRRGELVPEFEAVLFSLRPGQIGPVTKTRYGYHIIRTDRVQPSEVKGSHILISPVLDSNDIVRAFTLGDSVARLWASGTNFDSLTAKYHDSDEEKGVLYPLRIDTLPESYRRAVEGVGPGQVTHPFALQAQNMTKVAILQVITKTAEGEYSASEIRQIIRSQLAQEKQTRALLDQLRKRTYVSLRL